MPDRSSVSTAAAIAIAAFLIVAQAVAVLGSSSWPAADDFCNLFALDRQGLWPWMQAQYLGWSGRLLTNLLLGVSFTAVPLGDISTLSAAMGLIWLSICVVAVHALLPRLSISEILAAAVLVAWFWWVTLGENIAEATFWATGGIVYLFPLLFLVASPVVVAWLAKQQSYIAAVACFLWGALVGNGIELLVIPGGLLTLALAWRVMATSRLVSVALVAGFLFGALALLAAPGNFSRLAAGGGSLGEGLSGIIVNFVVLCLRLTYHSGWLGIVYIALLGLVSGVYLVASARRRQWLFPQMGVWRFAPLGFVVVGYLAYLPLAAAPGAIAGRTFIYFFFALALSALALAKCLHMLVPDREGTWTRGLSAISLFGAIWISVLAVADIGPAAEVRERFWERHQLLSAAGPDDEILVEPLVEGRGPRLLHTGDISSDGAYWLNSCFQEFYDVRSIRLESPS